jgi:hypothetical protein
MNWRSIRFRLTFWYTIVLLSGLVLFSVGSWLTLKRATASAKNTTLLRREVRLVEALNLQSPVLAPVSWKDRLALFSLTVPESNLVGDFIPKPVQRKTCRGLLAIASAPALENCGSRAIASAP